MEDAPDAAVAAVNVNEMFTFLYVSFWNLLYLCTIILRIDCRGNCECIFVCKPNASHTNLIRKPF